MQKLFLPLVILALTGCAPSIIPQSSSASQSPVTDDCTSKSARALEQKDVKQISLGSQPTTESGQVRAGQQLGYSFDAKTGQQFNFQTRDRICVQLYTPSNKLLKGEKLPEDGKYVVQVSVPQGSTSFKLDMSLGSALSSQSPSPSSTPSVASSVSTPPIDNSKSSQFSSKSTSSGGDGDQKVLDDIADEIFNQRHPELGGRKLQDEETELSQEWQQIRACDAIVDYTFHQRHPELNGRKIATDEKDLQNEWLNIRNGVSGC